MFYRMIVTTTIRINHDTKSAGIKEAANMKLRGKFSEYVETLIKADLKKKEKDLKSKEVSNDI